MHYISLLWVDGLSHHIATVRGAFGVHLVVGPGSFLGGVEVIEDVPEDVGDQSSLQPAIGRPQPRQRQPRFILTTPIFNQNYRSPRTRANFEGDDDTCDAMGKL